MSDMMNNTSNPNDIYTIDLSDVTYTGVSNSTGILNTGILTIAGSDWNFNTAPDFQVPGDAKFQGDIDVQGDVIVQGQSLKSWMQQVEQRLAILKPVPELEAEFSELRDLGDQYRKLQAELEAKMQTWHILKKSD